MEYYSQYDMPCVDERIKSLKEYADKKNYKSPDLDLMITKIISETPEFSLSGYSVFGKVGEQNMLDLIFLK